MVVLDTDHLSVLALGGKIAARLEERLVSSGQDVTTTVVCVEERINGWMTQIRRRDVHEQVEPYREFYKLVETYARWTVLPWDEEAADLFLKFRSSRVRLATMDLKIACIAMAHDALLLTRNTVDFQQVPGLRFENWLD